jgi:hypothetical protein
MLSYGPGFHTLTEMANPQLAQARANVAITLLADPSTCSFQLDVLGFGSRSATSCDIARGALAANAARFMTEAYIGPAIVRLGNIELQAPEASGQTRAAVRSAREKFQARLRDALVISGYPPEATRQEVNSFAVATVISVFILAATAMYGPLAAFLVEFFPAQIRYAALSFPYHVGSGWFGGLMPAIAFAIMAATGDIYAGLWYPLAVTAVAFVIMLFFVPETRGRPIHA